MQKIIILLVFSLTTYASANEAQLSNCAKFENNNVRLKCYDQALGYKSPSAKTEPTKWAFMEKQDAFTDSNRSFVRLNRAIGSSSGNDAPATLVVRCDGSGDYELFITTDGFIGGEKSVVRYRFDGEKAISSSWSLSTDGTAVFLSRWGKKKGLFETQLETGKDFIVEIQDYNGTPNSAKFENNKDKHLEFIMNGCQK